MTEKKTLAEWMLASLFQKQCHFHRARKSRCPVGHSPRVPAAPVAAAGYAQGEFGRAGACALPPSLRHVVHGVQPGRESRSARIPTGLMPMRAAAKRPILTSFAKPPPQVTPNGCIDGGRFDTDHRRHGWRAPAPPAQVGLPTFYARGAPLVPYALTTMTLTTSSRARSARRWHKRLHGARKHRVRVQPRA